MNIVKYYNGKELTMIIESISIRLLQDLKKRNMKNRMQTLE